MSRWVLWAKPGRGRGAQGSWGPQQSISLFLIPTEQPAPPPTPQGDALKPHSLRAVIAKGTRVSERWWPTGQGPDLLPGNHMWSGPHELKG